MMDNSATRPAVPRRLGVLGFVVMAAAFIVVPAEGAGAPPPPFTHGPIEHIRGIYLQRTIEIATVGARTVHLTRMTRFRRCGVLRGMAEDFNEHFVDVAGREVEGIGFVAGLVSTIEGCTP